MSVEFVFDSKSCHFDALSHTLSNYPLFLFLKDKAPSLKKFAGTHLEADEYHMAMQDPNTVIIDVRNHYEANIGRFNPPENGAQMIDPKMRKSTEFPIWLENNKEKLRGKQVLMYCTGGVR